MRSIFISYAMEDFQYAEKIFHFLREQEFDPWMDKKNLLPGQKWEYILNENLRKADFIMLLISSNSVSKRGYIQREFKLAIDYCEEKLDSDIFVIPVKIDSCEIPPSLRKFHWVEYASEDFQAKIHEAITSQAKEFERKSISSVKNTMAKAVATNSTTNSKLKRNISNKKKRFILLFSLILVCIVTLGVSFLPRPTNKFDSEKNTTEKQKVYNFIVDYFDNINSYTEVERFFADQVRSFYKRTNVTLREIANIRRENDEFIDAKHKIDQESLSLASEGDEIQYWRFVTNFVCFRRTLNKFETAKVLMEFGINKDFKITSVKEIQTSYKFTKEKPLNY